MNPSQSATTLQLRRFIPAPRARVFAAFTDPKQYAQWIGCGPKRCLGVKLDARKGGKYEVLMKAEDGGQMQLHGEYLEVRPPERLVFSWSWEGAEEEPSQVTVELFETDGGTDLHLLHERLPSLPSRDRHTAGWTASFDQLFAYCAPGANKESCGTGEAEPAMAAGQFCWNELLTSDVGTAGKFYSQLFGWSETPFDGPVPYTVFRMGEKGVGGMMAQQQPGTPPLWLNYVGVTACDASVARVEQLGGKVCMPPKAIPTIGRIAVVTDPLGAPFGLHQPEAE